LHLPAFGQPAKAAAADQGSHPATPLTVWGKEEQAEFGIDNSTPPKNASDLPANAIAANVPTEMSRTSTSATPPLCPMGHNMRRAAAAPSVGRCTKCSREATVGELVLACQPCQWHLCGFCEPIVSCLKCERRLQPWASQRPGRCDGCDKAVAVGEMTMDCRRCDWYLCSTCRPSLPSQQVTRVKEVFKCPKNHSLELVPAISGTCDVCGAHLRSGERVMSCNSCNDWCMCEACQANPPGLVPPAELQCRNGHTLMQSRALAGWCDGCRRQIWEGQDVQDCRTCNYYLCTRCCHLAQQEQQRRSTLPGI